MKCGMSRRVFGVVDFVIRTDEGSFVDCGMIWAAAVNQDHKVLSAHGLVVSDLIDLTDLTVGLTPDLMF